MTRICWAARVARREALAQVRALRTERERVGRQCARKRWRNAAAQRNSLGQRRHGLGLGGGLSVLLLLLLGLGLLDLFLLKSGDGERHRSAVRVAAVRAVDEVRDDGARGGAGDARGTQHGRGSRSRRRR